MLGKGSHSDYSFLFYSELFLNNNIGYHFCDKMVLIIIQSMEMEK
jgi:hypothetical protein